MERVQDVECEPAGGSDVGGREETCTKKLCAIMGAPDGRVATAKFDVDAMNTVCVDDRKILHDIARNGTSSTAVTQI